MESIQFKKLHPDAIIPARATAFSAGFDLYALEDTNVLYGGSTLVPTGVAVQVPFGTYGRIAMRSGLAVKQHLAVSAGVIDVDYTGPIGVVVFCTLPINDHFLDGYLIKKGERFAQLVIEKISYATGVEVKEFTHQYLDHIGFGSTGSS